MYHRRLTIGVVWITERNASLSEEAVPVFLLMMIIAGVAIAYRCKQPHVTGQLIVGIQACLYGEKP